MAGLPNILFVTADQFRGDCLSGAGHPVVRTPNLDRLAGGGVSFRRHFANAAPCGPSRASLYTGMYLCNHRAVINGSPLDDRFTNFAREARRAGYEPALFGYTDTGVDPRTVSDDDPRLRTYEGVLPGLDAVCDLPEGDPRAWLTSLARAGYTIPEDWRAFVDRPATGTTAQTQYRAEHSQTAFLTERVLDYVDDRGSAPWFVHLSYLRPHPPYLAPPPYDTMYDPELVPEPVRAPSRSEEAQQHPLLGVLIDHPLIKSPDDDDAQREFQAAYYGMITEVDTQFGRLFDWLEESGQAGNTIVIMTSDHGELLGDHWLVQKHGWFDTAFHVPLIIRDPRPQFDAARGTTTNTFTEHVDVTPTICDLLGIDVPLQCDGRPLTSFLEGAVPIDWRTEVHHEL
ncbi:MAG: sulfatase-like hydrolase/transferase, partial [Acidimicrobiia bacterium]